MNLKTRTIEFCKGIGTFFLFFISPVIFTMIVSALIKNTSSQSETIILIISQLLIILLFTILFRKTLLNDFKDMKKNYKDYLKYSFKLWFYGLIGMMICNLIINVFINPGGLATNEELNREIISSNLIYSIIATLIYAPIVEEITFRAGFKKAFEKTINFAVFSGILFAGLHVSTAFNSFDEIITNWEQLLYFFPYASLGFAFGYIYSKTNNIFSTIIVHFAHNLLSVCLILLSLIGG